MRTCRNLRHVVPGTTLLAACCLMSFLSAAAARAAAPVERHDWAVGLAWGLGNGSVTLVDQAEGTAWARGGSPQIRVGRRAGSHLMVGLENRQWLHEAGPAEDRIRGNEWGETCEVIYKHDAGGWGAVLGLGYEFRSNRHCAAGLAVSYNSLSFDDDVFEEAEFVPASLNLNWYF